MTKDTQKKGRNLSLKVAIVEAGRSQRDVASEIQIGEVRLSNIIGGREQANARVRKALAKALKRPVSELFPQDEALAS